MLARGVQASLLANRERHPMFDRIIEGDARSELARIPASCIDSALGCLPSFGAASQAFERATDEPVWSIKERAVDTTTDVSGEELYPTQPFPTRFPENGNPMTCRGWSGRAAGLPSLVTDTYLF